MAKEATARGLVESGERSRAESGDERAEEMKREQAHGERRVLRSLCRDIPRDRQPYAPEDDDDDDDDDDVYEPSAAVEDRSIVVDGIANAARLLQRRRCLLRIFERVHDVVACRTKNDDDCQRVEDDGWRGEEKAPVVEMLLRERRW